VLKSEMKNISYNWIQRNNTTDWEPGYLSQNAYTNFYANRAQQAGKNADAHLWPPSQYSSSGEATRPWKRSHR